jgi:hypothetical protein
MLAQEFGREWIRYRELGDPRPATLKKIVTDAEGNAYVIGQIESETTGLNWLTIKYSPSGEKLWQKEHDNHVENGDDIANDIAVDDDGNVYVTGFITCNDGVPAGTYKNTYTIKYDALGNLVWGMRFLSVDCESEGTHIAVNKMNGDLIVGQKSECTDVLCYDSHGRLRWQHPLDRTIPIALPGAGGIAKLLLDDTGNVYVTGYIFLLFGEEFTHAVITFKLNADGIQVIPTMVFGLPTRPFPPFDDLLGLDMTLDELNNVYLFVQRASGSVVLGYGGSYPGIILTLSGETDFRASPTFSSTSIKIRDGDFYLSCFSRQSDHPEGFYQIKKFNRDTRELLWEKEDYFDYPLAYDPPSANFPPMQMDESGNVYIAGPVASSYKIISYRPNGLLRRYLYEFPSPPVADNRIQGFHVNGVDKVYVAANRKRPGVNDYLVAKYTIRPGPDPDPAKPIIPPRLRDYERFDYAAYAPGRDWCWTGINIDWEIICRVTPSLCPDFPVTTLTENGKTVWQKKLNKPGNFLLPIDDKLPRQLSVAIPIGKSSEDVIILGDNLVHSGISAMQVSTYGEKNLVEIKAETLQGKEVPFTMTLLNKDGKEIWQATFVAPLVKQIEAYVDEPGVALKFSAITKELQLNFFPNPFSENITVDVVANKTSPVQVTILSMKGETILQEQIEETGAHILDMKNQKQGLYILVLKQDGNEVRKLIELRK